MPATILKVPRFTGPYAATTTTHLNLGFTLDTPGRSVTEKIGRLETTCP